MRTLLLLPLAAGLGSMSTAQERSGDAAYKVEYRITDAGEIRTYTMIVDASGRGQLRMGQRTPYASGIAAAGSTAAPAQINYAEIGVNIDCRLRPSGNRIALHSDIELSSVIGTDRTVPLAPTIASTHLSIDSVAAPGQRTLLATVDDPATKRRLNIEATLSKLD